MSVASRIGVMRFGEITDAVAGAFRVKSRALERPVVEETRMCKEGIVSGNERCPFRLFLHAILLDLRDRFSLDHACKGR